MACRDIWKESLCDHSPFWDTHNSSSSKRVSPDFRHKQTGELLWLHGRQRLPSLTEELRRSGLKDEEFCLHKTRGPDDSHHMFEESTLLDLIKGCGKQKDLHKGSSIHSYILERGLLEKEISLGNALLSMYARCGMLAKAQETFDELPARNVVTWNALIAGYAHHGLGDEALICFERMRDAGLSPNAVTFICILKACGSIGATEKGEEIHAEVDKDGLLEKDIGLGTALVDMYAKCGMLVKAQAVFDKLPTRNVAMWTALIAGYTQHGLGVDALSCFGRMQAEGISPNIVTFLCILKACGSIGAIEKGEEIHAKIWRQGLLENDVVLGTTLVDMYAKCGALAKAQGVFDKLPTRNVVTWNALIAGYAQHGLGDEALSCFGQMQDEGVPPNRVTFVCILKACGSIGVVQKGEEIHAEVGRQGLLETDKVLGTAVVDMYAKCGALSQAQGVFDKLPTRDVVMWNVLIAGYSQQGLNDEALSCFKWMCDEGLSPDIVTFICILKACGNIGAEQKGEEIHADIQRQGLLEKDDVLGSALVDMYAKCGALAKAQRIFDKLQARTIDAWNALIAGYAQQGLGDQALSCLEQMRDEAIFPDAVTFIHILKACGSMGVVEKGEEIHAEVSRQGLLEKDDMLGTALVHMYAKCGALAKAQGVFDKLPTRDVTTWTALIAGYTEHGLCYEALSCFGRMRDEGFHPNAVTFTCILQACGSIGAAQMGKEIHAEVSWQGLLEKDSMLGTALVDMYAKCGMLTKAQGVFDKLLRRNVVTWNALISGYAQHGLNDEALRCFGRMREEGFFPDTVTFICVLKACGNIGATQKAEEIDAEVSRLGLIEKDSMLGTALVDMYAKCGALSKAQRLFNKLAARNSVTWNALIMGYAEHGLGDEALSCFAQMQKEGFLPDAVTFICILKACGSIGATEKGEEVHVEVRRKGLLGNDIMVGTALVDMYARCGELAKAQDVFDKLSERGIATWTALITGYAQTGKVETVFDSFFDMIGEGIEPDTVTFVILLTACSHGGVVAEGQTCFYTMSTVYCINPTAEHRTCMVDIFSRAGQFDKAISVIEKAPPFECLLLWSALIGACQKWANVELGRWAFEHAIQLDEKFAPAYVCISNLYAAAGIQESD